MVRQRTWARDLEKGDRATIRQHRGRRVGQVMGKAEQGSRGWVSVSFLSPLPRELTFGLPLSHSETNWHTMLYLIRCTFAVADRSSKAFFGSEEFGAQPPEEGAELISKSRALFRGLADDSAKGKERGFLLGLLEIAREARRRQWEAGEFSACFGE